MSHNKGEWCFSNCNCSSDSKRVVLCKYCKSPSIPVKSKTVKRFIKKDFLNDVEGKEDFYLCSNSECKISYFSYSRGVYFTIDDLKIPIWFKSGANPKIICYCHRLTEDMIREQVIKNNLTSFKDIVLQYRKRVICKCDELNPTGRCCTKYFYAVINETLLSVGRDEVIVPENCY